MSTFIYLINSAFLLLFFTGFYYLVLSKLKNYRLNRVYLIFIGIIAIIFPSITKLFTTDTPLYSIISDTIIISNNETFSKVVDTTFSAINLIGIIYILGLVIGLARAVRNYSFIAKTIKNCEEVMVNGVSVHISSEVNQTFTFMNKIVVPSKKINPAILIHEKAHVKEKHYIDLFFSELVCLIIWFIPFIRYYKRAIILNHELIADQYALGLTSKKSYGEVILSQTMQIENLSVTHSFFNYSLTKTRIIMLYKKPTSKLRTTLSYSLILPLLICAFILSSFGNNLIAQIENEENDTTYSVVEQMPEFEGGQEALFKFIGENIVYPEDAKEKGIEGIVYISFVISKTGKVFNPKVLRGDDILGKEAKRIVQEMPDWIPGKQDGKTVAVEYNLPIRFKL